jgi:hypothetical protein
MQPLGIRERRLRLRKSRSELRGPNRADQGREP